MPFASHYTGARDQCWRTPEGLFAELHRRFVFTMDGASLPENALLPKSSSSGSPLAWTGERVFCNPPWSDIPPFIELAARAALAVLLVPARVNAKWFHRALALGARAEFFQGRPKFRKSDTGEGKGGCPFDCCLLVFERTNN